MKSWLILLCLIFCCSCAATQSSKTITKTEFDETGKPIAQTVTEEKTPESPLGKSDFAAHVDGRDKHDVAEKDRIVAQTSAISAQPCPADGAGAAWCGAGKTFAIANLKPEPYGEGPPETILGAVDKAVPYGTLGYGFKKIGDLGDTAIKNAGSKYGDNAKLDNVNNHTEANPSNVGAGSASGSSQGTAPAQVVTQPEPIVVK